jgi:hypothetical protein
MGLKIIVVILEEKEFSVFFNGELKTEIGVELLNTSLKSSFYKGIER